MCEHILITINAPGSLDTDRLSFSRLSQCVEFPLFSLSTLPTERSSLRVEPSEANFITSSDRRSIDISATDGAADRGRNTICLSGGGCGKCVAENQKKWYYREIEEIGELKVRDRWIVGILWSLSSRSLSNVNKYTDGLIKK